MNEDRAMGGYADHPGRCQRLSRLAGRLAIVLSLATGGSDPGMAQSMRPRPPPVAVASDVPAIAMRRQTELPDAPLATRGQRGCGQLIVEPKTEAGRLVASHGWAVTGEAPLGPYRVVAFAGSLQDFPSAVCTISQGHLGFFLGSRLIALASSKQPDGHAIGRIETMEGDALRVWSIDMDEIPVADLHAAPDGSLKAIRLSKTETLCGGKATVPNVYGMRIDKARRVLGRAGWQPDPQPHADDQHPVGERAIEFQRMGLVEAEDCAGSGVALCMFKYRGTGGELSVVTSNERRWPPVASYALDCAKP